MLVLKMGSSTSKTNISCFANRGCDNHATIAVACVALGGRSGLLSSLRGDHEL